MPRLLELRLTRTAIGFYLVLATAWACFAIFGESASLIVADKLGDRILAAADGKIAEPGAFVWGRILECLQVATVFGVSAGGVAGIWRLVGKSARLAPNKGLICGVCTFVALNLVFASATDTALFMVPLHEAAHVDNLVQYQFKKSLMTDSESGRRIILAGNSQTNRAIDERIINAHLSETAWATELTQPGARGFDLLVLGRDMPARHGDLVVFYLSEISFYGMSSGLAVANFLKFSDLRDLAEMDGFRRLSQGAVRTGLLGRILPIHRFRQPLSNRTLRWRAVQATMVRHETPPDQAAQAREWAPTLVRGESADFECASFERLLSELVARGCEIILIPGHLHPVLRKEMDPAPAAAFALWFGKLPDRHPDKIKVLEQQLFFQPGAEDFDDLVHFNEAAQERFTRQLVGYLSRLPE